MVTSVTLLQPLGVNERIFPWGIHFIADHIEETMAGIIVNRRFLQRDPTFSNIIKDCQHLGDGILRSLTTDARKPFGGPAADGAAYDLTIYAAWLGPAILALFDAHNCFGNRNYRQVTQIEVELANLQSRFLEKIDAMIDHDFANVAATSICGMSVYDRTLFFCLSLASRLRKRSPRTKIILGGDYFTFESANAIIQSELPIDAVAVGYGEDIMSSIVALLEEGHSLEQAHIQGLVLRKMSEHPPDFPPIFPDKLWLKSQNKIGSLQMINVPTAYRASSNSNIKYVRRDDVALKRKTKNLRVMYQRGCSYGECTFCTQIDKKLYFRLNQQRILHDLREELLVVDPGSIVEISFDADEHAPQALLSILNFFVSDLACQHITVLATLWFQAKYMNQKIIKAIAQLRERKNIILIFNMNFETLNPVTLKIMDKGHTPLFALYSAKAVQDAGQHLTTNYMEYFPGEDAQNVASEAAILKRALHIIGGKVSLFAYSANGRDDIFQSQEKFGIEGMGYEKDFWIRDMFELDLPSSIWNFEMFDNKADPVTRSWHDYAKDSSDENKRKFEGLAKAANAFGYLERFQLFTWLRGVPQMLGKSFSVFQPPPVTLRLTVDRQKNFVLFKNYAAATGEKPESRNISAHEVQFLRFLYQPRTWKEVMMHFEGSISESVLRTFRELHERFGSVISEGDMFLSVANDPDWVASIDD